MVNTLVSDEILYIYTSIWKVHIENRTLAPVLADAKNHPPGTEVKKWKTAAKRMTVISQITWGTSRTRTRADRPHPEIQKDHHMYHHCLNTQRSAYK